MWNAVSFYKQYCRGRGVSSVWKRGAVCAAATVVVLAGSVRAWPVDLQGTQEWTFRAPGKASPSLARLFTPRAAPVGMYEVLVLDTGIEAARRAVWEAARPGGSAPESPEAWPVRELDPLEAFGEAGTYPRTTVARLYTGTRTRIVRAPVERAGRTVAAVTLISPYPDPSLTHLAQGTMVIVVRISN